MTLHGTYIEGEPMEGITPGMLNRIEVSGQKIVLPTHDPQRIQLFNEYTLNPNRCALVETPWGGLKGSSLPDNSVGTVRIISGDGCYLSDINGNNVSKTLQSGKLAELGHLSVDTTNHTITEEFVIQNTGSGSDVQVINACDSTVGWVSTRCTTSIDTVDKMEGSGAVKVTCTETDPYISYYCNLNLSTVDFITVYFKARSGTGLHVYISSGVDYAAYYRYDMKSSSDDWRKYVIPIRRPTTSVGSVDLSAIKMVRFGTPILPVGEVFHLDNVTACNGTWAQVEVAVPDNLNGAGSDVQVIDDCDSADEWSITRGTISLDTVDKIWGNGAILATATELDPYVSKTVNLDLSSTDFISVYVKGVDGKTIDCFLVSDDSFYSYRRYYLTCNGGWQKWVIPIREPDQVVGSPDMSEIRRIRFGIPTAENGETFRIDDITARSGTWVNNTDATFSLFSNNDTDGFWTARISESDFVSVSSDSIRLKSLDGISFNDMYGQWKGRGIYYLGKRGVTRGTPPIGDDHHPSNITYSPMFGTSKRAGFAFKIPPSDNGRTEINKVRLKLITYYEPDGDVTYEFSNDNDLSTGLYHLAKPWIGLLNEATGDIEYFVFSDHPDALQFTQNDAGEIYEIAFDPGNGNVSHGIIRWVDQSIDSDSDYIPDCLDEDAEGSLADMLHTTDFITILNTVYDLSTSSVVPNDFSITADDIDCFPFAVSYGNSVTDGDNNPLTPIEIVSTATGDVAIYDVKGHPTIKVHDAPGNNAGDCMVWDTVTAGNTNESTWVRVYDVNHVFTGDCVAENGLIRSIGSKVNGLNAILSYHNGSTWKSVNATPKIQSNPLPNTEHVAIVSISPDAVITRTKCMRVGYIHNATYDIILTRGSKHAVFVFVESSAEVNEVDITNVKSFGYMSDGGLLDTRGNDPRQRRAVLYGASLPTDSSPMRILMSCSSRDITISHEWDNIAVRYPGNTQMIIGAIPYPIQTYFEAESLNFASNLTKPPILPNELYTVYIRAKNVGATSLVLRLTNDQCATPYSGEDCYPFSGNTGVTLGSHIVKEVTFSEIGSEFGYGKADIMLTQEELDRVTSWQIVAPEANSEFILDYVLFVPTGMLDRYAKRSLVNLSPMTSTIEKTTR